MNAALSKAELSQLAQFKLLMRQVHQYSVDLSLFVSDQTYAKEVLDLAEDTDQENLMMMAIELRSQFGLLQAAQPIQPEPPVVEVAPVATPEPESKPNNSSEQDRYKFSLR